MAYSAAPQCYASILTTDLATTRDNIRQTVLDMMSLANAALKACGLRHGTPVARRSFRPARRPASPVRRCRSMAPSIGYIGQSLGGIIGTTFTASEPAIKASILNVPGVGLLDVLENTANLADPLQPGQRADPKPAS